MDNKKDAGELFIIRVTNHQGLAYFVCETETGIGFSDKVYTKTKLFYQWYAAKQFAKRFEGNSKRVEVLKMSNFINSDNAQEFGLNQAKNSDLKDTSVIVGYTDDGAKHWVHYDITAMRYFLKNQIAGACVWYEHQIDDVVTMLKNDKTISIKQFESEKINP